MERASGGIGFFGLLALVLIGLKLAEIGPVATWSWWWVLVPLWVPAAMGIAVAVGIGTLMWLARQR